jgi:hypothetical protein
VVYHAAMNLIDLSGQTAVAIAPTVKRGAAACAPQQRAGHASL